MPENLRPVDDADIQRRVERLSGWQRIQVDGADAIRKSYKQKDFAAGVGFVVKVAMLAEKEDHHPDVLLKYGEVVVTLTTHRTGGLTEADFQLAEKIEALTR